MASTSTQQGSQSPKRLAELLDEQQDPFVLEIYLLERGYRLRRSLELESSFIGCCSSTINHKNNNNNSNKFLKKSFSYHIGSNPISRKYSSAQFSSFARTLLSKLVSKKWMKKRKRREKQAVESAGGRCSSVSCSTTLSTNCWSDSDTDEEIISMTSRPAKNQITISDQLASEGVMGHQWRFVEENKQCSPVSVLEEIDLLQAIPVYNVRQQPHEETPAVSRIRFQKTVSEDAILSASLWELLVQLKREKPKSKQKQKQKERRGRKPFPDYMNSKRALQQSRQLLFDCVRETIEHGKQHKNRSSSNSSKGLIMGPEEIGKIICRNLKTWGRLSADETNIKQVLRMDLFSVDEWGGGFDVWKKDIVDEIGNGLLDEITEEIIRELIDQF